MYDNTHTIPRRVGGPNSESQAVFYPLKPLRPPIFLCLNEISNYAIHKTQVVVYLLIPVKLFFFLNAQSRTTLLEK